MRSIAEIRALLKEATPESFPALECALASDERKGVQQALATARRRIEREEQEHARSTRLYTFEQELGQTARSWLGSMRLAAVLSLVL